MELVDKAMVRSCTTCAKAKAKCVRKPGAHICERCARLSKECLSKEPILRRKKPIKQTRTAQLEKLENKIEHLVNALASQQANRSSAFSNDYSQQQQSPSESQISSSTQHAIAQDVTNKTNEVISSLCDGCDDLGKTPIESGPAIADKLEMSLRECDIMLDRWRRLMSTGMPFVIVPEGVTAMALEEQKPVLLRAICTVTLFHDLPRQQKMVADLNREIAERMFVKNEKSLDLMQAILVLVGWYHPHVFWSPQTTNLLHLASALTIDLGVDRTPSQCADFKGATTKAVHGPNLVQKIHTLEERRALIGVFCQTNMLSSSFRKLDTLPFTAYMEQCLTSLEQAREYDSDLYLIQMVRIQRIMEQIHTTDVSSAPARVYIRAFQADLDRLRRSDPCQEDNVFLRMQYLAAEILMWELSVNESQDNISRGKSLTAHLEDLYQCVTIIKSFLEAFFSISPTDYYLLPFTVLGQFAHVFICLTKIASLEVEGWDINALNEQINFLQAVEECARRFDESVRGKPDGLTLNNDSFGKWASKVRWMKQVYEAKFAQEIPEQQQQQPTPPETDPVMGADFFDYLDENFWSGMESMEAILFPGVEVS